MRPLDSATTSSRHVLFAVVVLLALPARWVGEIVMRKRLRTFAVLTVLVGISGLTTVSRAVQNPPASAFGAVGPQATRGYFSNLPFERVDMVNGNVTLTFPGFVLPGNAGMDVRITQSYRNATSQPVTFTDVPLRVNDTSYTPKSLVMADGTEKKLHNAVMALYWITTDFWKYDPVSDVLVLPDGRLAFYTVYASGAGDRILRLNRVEDRFGNTIRVFWDGAYGTVVDRVEQTVGSQTRVIEFTIVGATTQVTYDGKTWTYSPGSIQPPVGSGWSFNPSGFDSPTDWSGTLTITLPPGGTVAYEFIENNGQSRIDKITTGGRAVAGGTWQFSFDGQYLQTSTVTTPTGRLLTYKHELYGGPDGTDWILMEQSVSKDGSSSSAQMSYGNVPFNGAGVLKVLAERIISQDGHSFTTQFEYNSTNFSDYRRPWRITESASNHATTRVTTRTFDYNFVNEFIIDKMGSHTVAVAGESLTTSTEYDDNTGAVTSTTQFGQTTQVGTDAYGNLASVTDPFGHQTAMQHTWGAASSTTTPTAQITRAINSDGTVQSASTGGSTTSFQYDDSGRPTTVTPAAGAASGTTYDPNGQWVEVTRAESWTRTDLDGFGRAIGTLDSAGIRTATTYDNEGHKTFQSYPWVGSGGTAGTSFSYDYLGRPTRLTHADGKFVEYQYGPSNVSVFDENGHRTIQSFEAFGSPGNGRLASVQDPDNRVWEYSYNALGRLTRVNPPEDPGGPTRPDRTWSYNDKNQLTSETHPESGTTTYTYHPQDGVLATKVDGSGTTTYGFDADHRLTSIDAPGSTDDVSIEYDAHGNRTRAVYGGINEMRFTYDSANRMTQREDRIDGHILVTSFAHDARDNLIAVTYPTLRVVQYDYDAGNRIIKVYNGAQTYAQQIVYHPSGDRASLVFGNSTTESLTLDDRLRPNRLLTGSTADRVDLTYGYDWASNVTSITDPRPGKSSTFGYDALDRLITVTGFGANTFTYDAVGNRLTKGSPAVTYQYNNATGRLGSATSPFGVPEAATFTYDSAGNMTGDGAGNYTYSPSNQMLSATVSGTSSSYTYDADGLRIKKTTGSTTTYSIRGMGGQVLVEYEATGGVLAPSREYIYLGSNLLASHTPIPSTTTAGRVTALQTSQAWITAGGSVNVTVSGTTVPCPAVLVNFGDGSSQTYSLPSPYALPLVQPHTYASPGLYTLSATGQTTANGPCGGSVSATLEVRSPNVVGNGNFGNGTTGWTVVSAGADTVTDTGNQVLNFYRPPGSTQGVVLQPTGLAAPASAPLEATFKIGNSDTVMKRMTVIVHSSAWDDLAVCNFYLPPGQTLSNYTMRMHTTVAWSNATIAFYASDVNAAGSTGAYQLDEVTLTHKPLNSSAKTDCEDANRPTSGGNAWENLIANYAFDDTQWWTLSGPLSHSIDNGVLTFHRTTAAGTPQIATTLGAAYGEQWGGIFHQAPAGQRLALVFQMGNNSSTRQRVTVSLQESNASTYQSCVFWLPPNAPLQTYAMRTFAPVHWQYASLSIVPNSGGAASTHGWLLLDNVMATHVTSAILGTECFELGSYANLDAPAPAPAPTSVYSAAETASADELNEDSETPLPVRSNAVRPISDARAVPITVRVAGWGQGGITSSTGGLTCTGQNVTCTVWFTEGSTVTFTATPGSGDTFAGWAGPCVGTSTCAFLITSAVTLTGTFNPPTMLTYYHTDVLGSVRAITDAVGAPVTRHDYFAFGESASPPTGDPRRFLGEQLDGETGFDHLGARYYRNVWGRFTSVDPVAVDRALIQPQFWNRYAYALNNPLRFIDPTGLTPEETLPSMAGDRLSLDILSDWAAVQEPHSQPAVGMAFVIQLIQFLSRLGPPLQRVGIAFWNGMKAGGSWAWNGIKGIGSAIGRFFGGGSGSSLHTATSLLKGSASGGGHIMSNHVGLTAAQLSARLASNPTLKTASTFNSFAEAELAVQTALNSGASRLADWVAKGAIGRLDIDAAFNGGSILFRGASTPVTGTGVRLTFQGNGNGTYFLFNGFPTR